MKEIKFRAWEKSEKIMHMNAESIYDPTSIPMPPGDSFGQILRDKGCVVMQYTGLKDNTKWEQLTKDEQNEWLEKNTKEEWNGRKIYEGDILLITTKHIDGIWPVIWSDSQCGFYLEKGSHLSQTMPDAGKPGVFDLESSSKIIGNIYQDKDLLKK